MQTAKPSKQRKMVHQAPDHVRYKMFAAPLSDTLIASQGVKTLPVRSGDTIRVMRGDHKGFEGKITRVNRKEYKIYVEGLTREKVDGTAIFVSIHPSKVIITNLALDDKWRKKILERKKGIVKKEEAKEKPAKKKAPRKIQEVPETHGAKAPEIAEVEEKIVKEEAAVKEESKKKIARPRRKTAKKSVVAEKPEKAPEEEKPKAKPKRTKRGTTKKAEGGK